MKGFEIEDGLRVEIYHQIEKIQKIWQALHNEMANIFFSMPYLSALESSQPDMQFYYLLVFRSEKCVGALYFQQIKFQFKNLSNGLKGGKFLHTILKRFQKDLLICGNIFVTDQVGSYFCDQEMKDRYAALIIDTFFSEKSFFNKPPALIYIKDLDIKPALGYSPIPSFPNMILEISPGWKTIDQYLIDMKSKYRRRIFKAREKALTLERKILDQFEIENQKIRLFELYESILDEDNLYLSKVSENYLPEIKKQLKHKFQVIAYYKDYQIVAFITYLIDEQFIHTHFTGLEKSLNKTYALYFNLLIDMVEEGIARNKKQLIFSRTASEIKSTLGAEGVELPGQMRFRSSFINIITPILIKILTPSLTWVQRHPFNQSYLNSNH